MSYQQCFNRQSVSRQNADDMRPASILWNKVIGMEDQSSKQQNLRQKGKNASYGKIIKGCVQDAGSKLSIGSIPSTYEAIIYRNNSVQAFGSGSTRFQHLTDFTNIAPNQYQKERAAIFRWKSDEKMNRKGYGPFISGEKRMPGGKWVNTPGPGAYTQENADEQSASAKGDGNKRPIGGTEQRFKEKDTGIPGPADYNYTAPPCSPCWKSSFESRVKRDKYMPNNPNPGPGAYQPSLPQHTPSPKIVAQQQQSQNLQQMVSKVMGSQQFKRQYCYQLPDFVPKYSKIKNSPIFMQGIKDRFGDVKDYRLQKKREPSPGPGDYQIKSTFNEEKELVGGPGFASTTKRELFREDDRVGPNPSRVFLLGKKRFHLNLERKWI